MKRLSALLIAFALSLSLTACGSESSTPATSSAQGGARVESSTSIATSSTEEIVEAPDNDSSAIVPTSLEETSSEDPSSEGKQPAEQVEQTEPVAVMEQEPAPAPEPTPVETPVVSDPEPTPDPQPEPQQPEVSTPAPSAPVETPPAEDPPAVTPQTGYVIGNKNSKKYHEPGCGSVNKMKESNKISLESAAYAESLGYEPCQNCH